MEKKCRSGESYKFAFSLFRGWVWRKGETRREWKASEIHQILFHQFRAFDYFFFTSSGSDSSYSPSSSSPLVVWQLFSNNKLVLLFFYCTSLFKPTTPVIQPDLLHINESARAENSLFPFFPLIFSFKITVSFLLFSVQEWDGVREERHTLFHGLNGCRSSREERRKWERRRGDRESFQK